MLEVMEKLPSGNTKADKQSFMDAVQDYARGLGYSVSREKCCFGSHNLLIGDFKQAKFLLTAGYAYSGMAAWLEILRTFPVNQRHKVCFVLFGGRNGESSYRKIHSSETDRQMVLSLNHVGDGNHMRMYPTKALKEDKKRLTSLYQACGYFGTRDLLVAEEKKPFLLNIVQDFPYCVTIYALQDHKKGLKYSRKTRDTALDETNVNILRAALTTFICCDGVN